MQNIIYYCILTIICLWPGNEVPRSEKSPSCLLALLFRRCVLETQSQTESRVPSLQTCSLLFMELPFWKKCYSHWAHLEPYKNRGCRCVPCFSTKMQHLFACVMKDTVPLFTFLFQETFRDKISWGLLVCVCVCHCLKCLTVCCRMWITEAKTPNWKFSRVVTSTLIKTTTPMFTRL